MEEIKLVLFDVDGTLINTGRAGTRALNKAIEILYGVKNVCENFSLQGCSDRVNFSSAYFYANRKRAVTKDIELITRLYLEKLPLELRKSVKRGTYKKIKGVEKFIKFLYRRKQVLLGLGTGNVKKGAFLKLEHSGLGKYFVFGGFGEDSADRTVLLKKAVERGEKIVGGKINPKNVYVIGDTHKDVESAKEAGYHSAAVLGGFGDTDKIMKSSPEFIDRDFTDLSGWLIWLGLKKDPRGIKRATYICPDTPIEHAYYGMRGIDRSGIEDKIRKIRRIKGGP
mgnify:CR=1 FL=1